MDTKMEQMHGVDVSWMTQAGPKDKIARRSPPPIEDIVDNTPSTTQQRPFSTTGAPSSDGHNYTTNGNDANGQQRRRGRSGSLDKMNGVSQRRNSWFTNIAGKFGGSSSSNTNGANHTIDEHPGQKTASLSTSPSNNSSVPRAGMNRSAAVLSPATKTDGSSPYTPAPPKSVQAGFLGVFRRLSSGTTHTTSSGKINSGLVERKVLNIDHNRERCPIEELNGNNLRRVSFCVDVEIAPTPRYAGDRGDSALNKGPGEKKKMTEVGEGAALKNPKLLEEQKEAEGDSQPPPIADETKVEIEGEDLAVPIDDEPEAEEPKEPSKKKEKKKKSEEERKARKEKKRKLAEANGQIPIEIRYDSDSSSQGSSGSPKSQASPTINPVRIYRRCCQLRETPILKRITEQLSDPSNFSESTGMVNVLDLSGYGLQMGDVITLGDYFAVVPIREVLLADIELSDEGLRLLLAGLLAAKRPDVRRKKPKHEVEEQGGVIERLVLKGNKFGLNGWKHLSLFLYLCRSLKFLDLSIIPFPRQVIPRSGTLPNGQQMPRGVADIFAKSIGDRLGGSTLEVLNISATEPTMEQLGLIMEGVIKCGVRRLGLALNQLDHQGIEHVTKYIKSGKCEGLDLSGNELNWHMETLAFSILESDSLWALSLANCELQPQSLCRIMPALSKLANFRFIDLSHNHALFESEPSAVGFLRRYLPQIEPLKRIHFRDTNMTDEQAIALVEVLPEMKALAHIDLSGNTRLQSLADAKTETEQEEACALYASLMAATRVSKSIICVDIEVPSDKAGEIVKAMAKQVVAYCLRNLEHLPDPNLAAAVRGDDASDSSDKLDQDEKPPAYPDVLAHLVGHDVLDNLSEPDDDEPAPDEDYVIGGTGVVKALTCCLKNRGDESRRENGELVHEVEGERVASKLAKEGKAKDMSKHLLAGARKIRRRLEPALAKARDSPELETHLRKLTFLDETLKGIIKRFEDEFPDTREDYSRIRDARDSGLELSISPPAGDEFGQPPSDDDYDESKIHPPRPLSRSSSRAMILQEEEGRVLRAGHRFRSGFIQQEYYDMLNTIDDIGKDPQHIQLLYGMAEDLGGEVMDKVKEKGVVRTFKENQDLVIEHMKAKDPEFWDRFVESQHKAVGNIRSSKHPEDESAISSSL